MLQKTEQCGPGFGDGFFIFNIVLDRVKVLYNIHYTKYKKKDGE